MLLVGESVQTWPIILGAVATLALVTVSFALLYTWLVPAPNWRRAVAASLATATVGAGSWLLFAPLVAPQALGQLYFPVAILGGLSAMLATLVVRSAGAPLRIAMVFAIGWAILVFVPVAIGTFVTGVLGIEPLDHGGSLASMVAPGAAALAVLLVRGDRHRALSAATRLPTGLAAASVGALVVGWLGWLVSAELAIDLVSADILINGSLGAAGGIVGWLAVQRIRHQSTTLGAVVAGLVSGLAAVSAGAPLLSPVAAASSGVIAGGVACIFTLRRVAASRRQPWYLAGSHFLAGAIGIVLIGLLASAAGFLFTGQIALIQDQLVSTVAVASYSGLMSLLLWIGLRRIMRSVASIPGPGVDATVD